jgi:hypothetical protein
MELIRAKLDGTVKDQKLTVSDQVELLIAEAI